MGMHSDDYVVIFGLLVALAVVCCLCYTAYQITETVMTTLASAFAR